MPSTVYHPEMGDKPSPNLFHTHHNFGNSWSVFWVKSADSIARETFKSLRVRPLKFSPIEPKKEGEWSDASTAGEDGFYCLVTSSAHRKLMDAGLCCCMALLD